MVVTTTLGVMGCVEVGVWFEQIKEMGPWAGDGGEPQKFKFKYS